MAGRGLQHLKYVDAKSAVISHNTSGNNELVAAAGTNQVIQVWSYAFVVEAAVDVRFESAAGGTALSGQMAFTAAGEGISASAGGPVPIFETLANQALNMELSGAVLVQGHISYTVAEA